MADGWVVADFDATASDGQEAKRGGATVMVAGCTLGHDDDDDELPPSRLLLSRRQTVVELGWHVQLVHGSGRNFAPSSNCFLPIWQTAGAATAGCTSLRTPWQTGQQAPGCSRALLAGQGRTGHVWRVHIIEPPGRHWHWVHGSVSGSGLAAGPPSAIVTLRPLRACLHWQPLQRGQHSPGLAGNKCWQWPSAVAASSSFQRHV